MGQQQLLLVILVTIIVGIATVVAINVFGTSAANANRDAVRQDMLAAIANAQGFFLKPTLMGGGGGAFDTMTIGDLGIPGLLDTVAGETVDDPDTDFVENENGTYVLSGNAANQFTLTGTPTNGEDLVVNVTVTDGRAAATWPAAAE